MKKFKVLFAVCAIVLSVLTVFSLSTSAASVQIRPENFSPTNANIDSDGNISSIAQNRSVVLKQNIKSDVKQVLGGANGTVTFSFELESADNSALTTSIYFFNANETAVFANTITKEITAQQQESDIMVTITIGINSTADLANLNLKIKNITLSGTPDATPSPTPTQSAGTSPSPTPSGSPDGDEASPSVSPSGSPSASPSATAEAPTPSPTPTKIPGIIYEPTKDPYIDNNVTNPPPTLDPSININPDELATPVPEDPSSPSIEDVPQKDFSNDSETGLIILFTVLFVLLGIDIAAIIWRKKMGYDNIVNGGISRRKVRDDLYDYPDDDGTRYDFDDSFKDQFDNELDADDTAEADVYEDADADGFNEDDSIED